MDLQETLIYTSSILPLYLGTLLTTQAISDFSSEVIPFEDLESTLEKECENLDIEIPEVDIQYHINQVFNNRLYINPDTITLPKLKHELYHIKKKDSGSLLKYLLVEEPRATLYGCFNIKL